MDSDGDGVRERDGVKLAFVLLGKDKAKLDAISAMWAEIGVQAEPQAVSLPGLTADFLAPRTFDAALVRLGAVGRSRPVSRSGTRRRARPGRTMRGWESRRPTRPSRRRALARPRAARMPYYKDFQRIFADEVPALLLYYPVYTYGVRDKVHDVQMGPLNAPGDRFRSIANWYIVTKRVTVSSAEDTCRTHRAQRRDRPQLDTGQK